MVWHLCAFSASVPAGAVDYELTAVTDDVLTRSGTTRFFVPEDVARLAFVAKFRANRATRVFTPSLEVRRIRKHVKITSVANGIVDETPVTLVPTEELSVLASNPGTSAETNACLVALGTPELTDLSDAMLVRATATANLTAGAWTTVKITPEVQLEAGSYQLVGVIPYVGTTNDFKAVRFLIAGQVYRPGILALDSNAVVDPDSLAGRGLNFGSFTHLTVPEIQVFSVVGGSGIPIELWLYLKKA